MKTTFARDVPLFVLLCIFTGCGESKKWREEVQRAVNKLEQGVDKLALSVPGERYQRLIEDANSGDQRRRERAQQFARELFNIDLSAEYEASIWFGYDESKVLRADAFRSRQPGALAVQDYFEQQNPNLDYRKNVILPPPTSEEIAKQAGEHARRALNNIFAPNRNGVNSPSGAAAEPFVPRFKIDAAKQHFVEMARILSPRVQPMYKEEKLMVNWPLLVEQHLLFVVILKEDWEAHIGNIKVEAVVHRVGQPTQTINRSRIYTFNPSEFTELSVTPRYGLPRTVMFASHNMTGGSVITPEMLDSAHRLSTLLQEYHEGASVPRGR